MSYGNIAALPRLAGGLGVGLLDVAEDLAGGGFRLARQTARQAARELPPVVIGENMERVRAYARMIGAETIDDWLAGRQWTEELNAAWIRQMMRQGRRVIDIGPDFTRRLKRYLDIRAGKPNVPSPISDPYNLERRLLKGYPRYEKQFIRRGKWWGGVLDLSEL
ncbi:MAG: hypothetical protein KatS3mg022_2002 [Armatimonadota bacterium]|nr:MAG: hypothetical protein KatS3mg022_2002 [Armatimonadota bacterium]